MHSYLLTNIDLREAYLLKKQTLKPDEFQKIDDQNKKDLKYPYNLTLKDFIRHLLIPGVVYEERFPTTKKFNPLYFVGHSSFVLMNVLV